MGIRPLSESRIMCDDIEQKFYYWRPKREKGDGSMRWVPDHTGRFRWRPWYEAREIDALCERRIERFLHTRHSVISYPVSTDDLTVLIEQEASDLDLFADLAGQGDTDTGIEGITTFYRDRCPRVQIARDLSHEPHRQARLRTTLAHELGHVLLHDFARQDDQGMEPGARLAPVPPVACTPTVLNRGQVDWMEWQASYACGALLMPRSALQEVVTPLLARIGVPPPVSGLEAGRLGERVQGHFLVSEAAARVRLRQLGYLQKHTTLLARSPLMRE